MAIVQSFEKNSNNLQGVAFSVGYTVYQQFTSMNLKDDILLVFLQYSIVLRTNCKQIFLCYREDVVLK